MTNIIKWPKGNDVANDLPPPKAALRPVDNAKARAIVLGAVRGVWLIIVLVWPLLRWLVSLDVLFQLIRMVYHWNTPGVYAGWTFLLHFAVLTALTYFVSVYMPPDIERPNTAR